MSKSRIILADDHVLIRSGLKLLLQNDHSLEVVGEASNGIQALKLVEQLQPDVVILDMAMPGMGGIECLKEIKDRGIQSKVIILTMYEDESYIKAAMQAGADGYVQKSAVDIELFTAIKQVVNGGVYLSPQDSKALLALLLLEKASPDDKDPYKILSPREREVLRLHVHGYSLREISETLLVSIKTVDTYKTRVMEKLDLSRRSELITYALKYGLLSDK